jgi:hypothetical protein
VLLETKIILVVVHVFARWVCCTVKTTNTGIELLTTVYTMLTQFLSYQRSLISEPPPSTATSIALDTYTRAYHLHSSPLLPGYRITRSYALFSTCLLYHPIYYPSVACHFIFIDVYLSHIQTSEPSGICQYNTTRR